MQRKELIVLFAAILAGLSFRLALFSGMVCADDMRHAFHGYFLFADDGVKYANLTRDTENRNMKVAYSRAGLNLPVWVTTHLFGVHDWSIALVTLIPSLAGIVFISLLTRRIAGPTAGMLAGVTWACLPLDIYYATVLLQDNLFASLFALYLLFIAVGEHREGRSVFWCLLAAGLVLGYVQYVKESALIILGMTGVWAGWKCLASRRIHWRYLLVPLGFLVMQLLFCVLFWLDRGDALWYWNNLYEAMSRGATVWYTFPKIVGAYVNTIWNWWQLGWLFVIFPIAFVASMLNRNTRLRILLVALWIGQLYAIYLPSKSTPNLRYLMQISPLYVLAIAVGLAWILHRFPHRVRRVATPIVLVLVALASVAGLSVKYQRYQHAMGDGHRYVYAALMANAAVSGGNLPVYATEILPIRTQHALYQLNGYRKLLGGFAPLSEAYNANEGWVVVSTADKHFSQCAFPPIPDNWLQIYRHQYSPGKAKSGYTSLFKILPRRLCAEQLNVFPANGCITPESFCVADVSGFGWEPIDLSGPAQTYAFSANNTPVSVRRVDGLFECEVGGSNDPKAIQSGGLKLPVSRMQAFRCDMGFADPKNISTIHVTGLSPKGKVLMSWVWQVTAIQLPRQETVAFVFVPGKDNGLFRFSGKADRADEIVSITISVRVRTVGSVRWMLDGADVSQEAETLR